MASEFSRLTQSLDYPMLITTVAAGDEIAGCLVGFATQTSIDPERFLICISEKNHTHLVAQAATAAAAHLIPADRLDLAERFGSRTDDDPGSKFDAIGWTPGFGGAPLIEDCPSRFAGPIVARFDLGDHSGLLIDPVETVFAPGRWLGFADAQRLSPGHLP